jgi:hypothetical protein
MAQTQHNPDWLYTTTTDISISFTNQNDAMTSHKPALLRGKCACRSPLAEGALPVIWHTGLTTNPDTS